MYLGLNCHAFNQSGDSFLLLAATIANRMCLTFLYTAPPMPEYVMSSIADCAISSLQIGEDYYA
jgi:hypothetical protein